MRLFVVVLVTFLLLSRTAEGVRPEEEEMATGLEGSLHSTQPSAQGNRGAKVHHARPPKKGKRHHAHNTIARKFYQESFQNGTDILQQLEGKVQALYVNSTEYLGVEALFNSTVESLGLDPNNVTTSMLIRRALFFIKHGEIEDLADRFPNISFGYNWVSLLTEDEKLKMNGLKFRAFTKGNSTTKRQLSSSSSLPNSFDWRDHGVVGEVQDQGTCGDCYAFSAAGAQEGLMAIQNSYFFDISVEQITECSNQYGCGGGSFIELWSNNYQYTAKNAADLSSDYPYTLQSSSQAGTCEESQYTGIYTTSGMEGGYSVVSDDELKEMVLKSPVSIGISASCSGFANYASGIVSAEACKSCTNSQINHAVLIVGFGEENGQGYWIVKNSWGSTWGLNGFVWLAMDGNTENADGTFGTCGLNSMAARPTQTAFASSCDDGNGSYAACTQYGTYVNITQQYNYQSDSFAPSVHLSTTLLAAITLLISSDY